MNLPREDQRPKRLRNETITSQEVALKKEEIKDEYLTQLEIKKIEDKNRIEQKKLEVEAMKSPLALEIPGPPGSPTVSGGKQSGKDDLTGGLNELMNMVKSVTGAKLPALAALGGQLATDINNQDGKQSFLKKADADDDYLENSKKKPRSPYEVKAGSVYSRGFDNRDQFRFAGEC